ncbi:outer membrane protein assembly factor BamC [Ferrimonas sp. SCSIO 43195]|uniref:outer membrane protein assembly factor BamC n=1 Tax=Ferrimonas sp. SCSIO 43195 TaxID=2822844 RepID=UPI002074B296|nr:outer membrane protein assembly factor BamC [Ferrimonas sp. SCSIO 43195]USD36376.1 outer membrane protein assembly factor BamC [Ferrimonas sp. SCSIO 43195]
MKRVLLGVLVVSALAGCSTPLERRQASGSYDYTTQPEPVPMKVPKQLKEPAISSEYQLPGPTTGSQAMGARVDVRPPLQVLPLAPGTRLQEGADSVTVLIENQFEDINLKQEMLENLTKFLAHKSIPVTDTDNSAGVLKTDWIETVEEFGGSIWGKDEYRLRQRYQFNIEVKDNGRTGALTIELTDHEELIDEQDQDVVLTDSDKRRYSIDMLNNAISYMNFQRKQERKIRQIQDSEGMELSLGKDADGNAAFTANAEFERVWSRLDKVLPVLGFTVKDLDKSQGTYYVDYDPNQGFWASLWGDNDLLALKSGAYRIKLSEEGGVSALSFQDADGQPLDDELVTSLYEQFAQYMKKNARSL